MKRSGLIGGALLGLVWAVASESAPSAAQEATYMLQLASLPSKQAAEVEQARLLRRFPDLLADMTLSIQAANLGERGTFYRVRTGPFPNQETAADFCGQIRAAQGDCLVVPR